MLRFLPRPCRPHQSRARRGLRPELLREGGVSVGTRRKRYRFRYLPNLNRNYGPLEYEATASCSSIRRVLSTRRDPRSTEDGSDGHPKSRQQTLPIGSFPYRLAPRPGSAFQADRQEIRLRQWPRQRGSRRRAAGCRRPLGFRSDNPFPDVTGRRTLGWHPRTISLGFVLGLSQ
ncbi:unannotated protein [freshwater metagenome]|uniref:Unannotated protein n=1 Tax=freshwater metagenome TaxID=449393 RepID=A0A6J6ZCV8_9ZZZZ